MSRTGRLGRNSFVGIRTRWTLRDDESWDRGQRAGWLIRVANVPMLAVAIALVPSATSAGSGATIALVLATLALDLVITAVSTIAASRAARGSMPQSNSPVSH